MRHEAIYATHPNVVRIDDSYGAFDINDQLIELDESAISQKIQELQAAEPLRMLRAERDQLIVATDWRATVDYPGSDQAAWLTYRQALRDLPANSTPSLDDNGQLTGVTWPTPPE